MVRHQATVFARHVRLSLSWLSRRTKRLSDAPRLLAFGLLVAVVAPSALAQLYPMPGHTSQAPVICTTCPNYPNAPTWPYASPLTSFIGRYVDSQLTRDYQAAFGMRTLRAGRVEVVPEHNRVYMIIGSTFASYDLSTFFTHDLGQPLSGNDYVSGTWRDGPLETHLRWDGYVYPEGSGSGWQTSIVDIQDFLYGFDTDDRNLVYLAYSAWGWGIVRSESNGSLTLVSQQFSNNGVSPTQILSLKSGSSYYALISAGGDSSLVYDVTNPVVPTLVRTLDFGLTSWAKTDAHVALITGGSLRIYTTAALISGEAALAEFSATAGQFQMVDSDGEANFFAVENHSNSPLRFSVFTPTETGFLETKHSNEERFLSLGMRYGSGHVTVWGYDSTFKSDVRVFRLANLVPSEIGLNAFFKNYYTAPPTGYARPDGYTDAIRDVLVHNHEGRDYLFYANHGLGDVYELNGTATPTPTPSPTPVPTTTPTPTPTPSGSCDGPPTSEQGEIGYYSNYGGFTGCQTGAVCAPDETLGFALLLDFEYQFDVCHAVEWDFNGLKKFGRFVEHSFSSEGEHPVTATITVNGSSTTFARTVIVDDDAPPMLTGVTITEPLNSSLRRGAAIRFVASALPDEQDVVFTWYPGDGTTASGKSFSKTFEHPRSYTVGVTASRNGVSSSSFRIINIFVHRPADFRGANSSQTVVYRNGAWVNYSDPVGGIWTGQSSPNCIPAPADYDGDGVTEMAMLCNGAWSFYNTDGTLKKSIWTSHVAGDLPVPADYDGDGDDDVVVYRGGAWRFFDYATGNFIRGVWTGPGPNTIPVPGDYDGDGKADFSVYQGGPWHFYNPDGTYLKGIWTARVAGDIPVPGDYTIDGKDEVVIFRGGAWVFFDFVTKAHVRGVWTGAATWKGLPLQPAPLDTDGDGTVEFTVFAGGPWHFFYDHGSYWKGVWTGGVAGDQAISRRQHVNP